MSLLKQVEWQVQLYYCLNDTHCQSLGGLSADLVPVPSWDFLPYIKRIFFWTWHDAAGYISTILGLIEDLPLITPPGMHMGGKLLPSVGDS